MLAPLAAILFAAAAFAQTPGAPVPKAPENPTPAAALDLSVPPAVIDLGPSLEPRAATDAADTGTWFTIAVQNTGNAPIARVLTAAESPAAALALAPALQRPTLSEAAASDPMLVIERATAYGQSAFRIVVPPNHPGTLALHLAGVAGRPALLAWAEPALIAHNRQVAVLQGLVSGLLTAAMVFALGAAVLSGRIFARWVALFLAGVLMANLSANGIFDGRWLTSFGGPYGFSALALAVAIAAAIRVVDYIAAFEAFYARANVWRDYGALAIAVLGLAAFAGVPFAGVAIRVLALLGAAAASGYLAHCGRLGIAGARRLAPAATIFALVTAAAAFDALGYFGVNLVAADAINGLAAAGALLVALTSAIPTEHAMERLREFREAHRHDDVQATVTDEALETVRELAAIAASRQGVFDLDLESGLLSLSSEAAAILGLPPGAIELSREAWSGRIHADDRSIYDQAIETYRHEPGTAFRLEFRARAGARMGWFELRATMTGQGTEAERCLGLIADVSARKSLEARNQQPSDALTGLGTRAALATRLEALGGDLKRVSLAVLDFERFRAVNKSLGHDAGDTLLREIAERLSGFAQAQGIGRVDSFRMSGQTFAVLAFDVPDDAELGRGLTQLFKLPFAIDGREVFLPHSVGVAAGADARNAEDLISRAELAMNDAKRLGVGRASVYSNALSAARQHDPVALETGLRHALERGEIEVHYQPIVLLKDDSIAGFEALLRWRHPERGLTEPDDFIPHAEQSGLIHALGDLALRRALADLAAWQEEHPSNPPLFVSVNVTWRQLADEEFGRSLAGILAASNLPKRSLRLEVTESAVMAGAGRAEDALQRLKQLGLTLAVDDFGAGHSSLSHLRRFPFDVVKIDKSFLGAAHERNGATILNSMIALAHELRLAVVAEGVESRADVERLIRMGCEYGQGYLFGQALPPEDVSRFIASLRAQRADAPES